MIFFHRSISPKPYEMMIFLAIDTSNEDGYVALFKGARLVSHVHLAKKMQTSNLLQKIDSLLKDEGFTLENITYYAVCTGPGSFTGVRIGVITAQTLGFAKSKPVIGYSAFVGRSPQMVFIGKRKIAYRINNNEEILYGNIDEIELGEERELDFSTIGRHLEEKALNGGNNKAEGIEISYPEAL